VHDLIERYEAEGLASGLIYLELSMYGYGELVIEETIKHRQMVVCYWLYDASHHPVPEPEIWFYLGEGDHWIPYAMRRHTIGHRVYAVLNEDASELTVTDEANQAALAEFADSWAEALRAQGWIGGAEKIITQPHPWPDADAGQLRPPPLEDLWEWVGDYGKCTATDGCWVAPGGVCEHGHQSWLVELGEVESDRLTTPVADEDSSESRE
jgi:hypothetical protein